MGLQTEPIEQGLSYELTVTNRNLVELMKCEQHTVREKNDDAL